MKSQKIRKAKDKKKEKESKSTSSGGVCYTLRSGEDYSNEPLIENSVGHCIGAPGYIPCDRALLMNGL